MSVFGFKPADTAEGPAHNFDPSSAQYLLLWYSIPTWMGLSSVMKVSATIESRSAADRSLFLTTRGLVHLSSLCLLTFFQPKSSLM